MRQTVVMVVVVVVVVVVRHALGIRWIHFVTNKYLHVLPSTADVIIEQLRLSFFGRVAWFRF
jgi:hypothetical protein